MNDRCRTMVPALALSILTATAISTAPASASTVINCAIRGFALDPISRGIVVPEYPGNNIGLITLRYGTNTIGTYRITLEVHRGTFDGPLIGTQTASVSLPGDLSVEAPVLFDLGGAPVNPGDTLAIIQKATGPGNLWFDGGMPVGPTDPQPPQPTDEAYQTTDVTPPLSTYIVTRVGLEIDQDALAAGGCIPSDTVLCIDRKPGDRRFQVTVAFSTAQAGGKSGDGPAIPTRSLGASRGGLFWFFSADNPEMLVKVLDGCAINGNFWVFSSAGTNVGYSLTVLDTVTGVHKVYTNPDLNAAPPLQDTSALSCSSPV
ncbi:MAG TPA: hypothetical protein VGE98_16870 [Thermoanaerobaculia bacterium]